MLYASNDGTWSLRLMKSSSTSALQKASIIMLCIIILSPSQSRPAILTYETVFFKQSINHIRGFKETECFQSSPNNQSINHICDRMFCKGLEPSNCTTNGTTVRRAIHCSIPSSFIVLWDTVCGPR